MARSHVSVVITEFDHPKLELDADDGDGWATIRIDEATTIAGDPAEIRRWAQELALQAAGVEA